MATYFSPYFDTDFQLIRDFISQNPTVWWIDRLNFTATVSAVFNGTSHEAWAHRIGLWRDAPHGSVLAVVLGEGEGRGETFILAGPGELPTPLVREIFDFIEKHGAEIPEGKTLPEIHLRLSPTQPWFEDEARRRGFVRGDWSEAHAWLGAGALRRSAPRDSDLPKGFSLVSARDFANPADLAQLKADVHAGAWGYLDKPVQRIRGVAAFARVTVVPDYHPDLDLVVLDAAGNGAAMAAYWYDERNYWGILEPMATHTHHHRRGLGRALVAEGLERLEGLGAKGLWVGNDLPFYLALGFQVKNRIPVWQRV